MDGALDGGEGASQSLLSLERKQLLSSSCKGVSGAGGRIVIRISVEYLFPSTPRLFCRKRVALSLSAPLRLPLPFAVAVAVAVAVPRSCGCDCPFNRKKRIALL